MHYNRYIMRMVAAMKATDDNVADGMAYNFRDWHKCPAGCYVRSKGYDVPSLINMMSSDVMAPELKALLHDAVQISQTMRSIHFHPNGEPKVDPTDWISARRALANRLKLYAPCR